ncbi:unnamed protein product [Hymenolepis diminuta]|uniref:Uncharacterized protein n=1 Tax=Hymenolepis diminuta TaxID=6216 RepID=A0A0R3SWW5_HYMDI|nr:unnamed protein product [Hymenolepis diminuta]
MSDSHRAESSDEGQPINRQTSDSETGSELARSAKSCNSLVWDANAIFYFLLLLLHSKTASSPRFVKRHLVPTQFIDDQDAKVCNVGINAPHSFFCGGRLMQISTSQLFGGANIASLSRLLNTRMAHTFHVKESGLREVDCAFTI